MHKLLDCACADSPPPTKVAAARIIAAPGGLTCRAEGSRCQRGGGCTMADAAHLRYDSVDDDGAALLGPGSRPSSIESASSSQLGSSFFPKRDATGVRFTVPSSEAAGEICRALSLDVCLGGEGGAHLWAGTGQRSTFSCGGFSYSVLWQTNSPGSRKRCGSSSGRTVSSKTTEH